MIWTQCSSGTLIFLSQLLKVCVQHTTGVVPLFMDMSTKLVSFIPSYLPFAGSLYLRLHSALYLRSNCAHHGHCQTVQAFCWCSVSKTRRKWHGMFSLKLVCQAVLETAAWADFELTLWVGLRCQRCRDWADSIRMPNHIISCTRTATVLQPTVHLLRSASREYSSLLESRQYRSNSEASHRT